MKSQVFCAATAGLVLALAAAGVADERDVAEQLYEAGAALYQAKDYDGAMAKYLAIVEMATARANTRTGAAFHVARCWEEKGQEDKAVEWFNRTIELGHPLWVVQAYHRLGRLRYMHHDHAGAMPYFKQAVAGSGVFVPWPAGGSQPF